jgi:hypothetical protein
MENNELQEWVDGKLSVLAAPSSWQPDSAAALRRVQSRRGSWLRWWLRWPAWAVAAAAFAVAAQPLWQLLTLSSQVSFVHVQSWPKGAPFPQVKLGGLPIPPIAARDVEQVRQRVGYQPRLPRPGVLADAPRLSTTFSVSAGTVVHVADLRAALRLAGVTNQAAPAEWDGARLSVRTSAVAIAEWPGLALVQSLPLTVSAPGGFDFPAFSAMLLRVFGVGPGEAQRLVRSMGNTPACLIAVTPDFAARASVEEVTLNSGPGTLIRDGDRITLIWSVPDRLYALDGKVSRDLVVATANAVE